MKREATIFGKVYPLLLGTFLYKYLNKHIRLPELVVCFFSFSPHLFQSFQIGSTLKHKMSLWFGCL